MQEVSKREGEINGYATDVERQLRARSRATSQALAALLRQIDGARARELCAAAEAAPPDAKRRFKELQQGASCPGAEDASAWTAEHFSSQRSPSLLVVRAPFHGAVGTAAPDLSASKHGY